MGIRLLAAALAVACLPIAASAQDRFVFGGTENETAPRATLTLDGVTRFFATNTGWYDQFGAHNALNPNYLTGVAGNNGDHRSFFSFALGALNVASPYTSAVLTVSTGTTAGTLPLTLTLRDVAASTVDLAGDTGFGTAAGQAIYADLGTGTSYGSYVFTAPTAVGGTVSIALNQAFLSQLNAGLLQDFSLGGSLDAAQAAVPEPATWALMLLGFAVAGTAMRRRRTTVVFAA